MFGLEMQIQSAMLLVTCLNEVSSDFSFRPKVVVAEVQPIHLPFTKYKVQGTRYKLQGTI